MFLSPKSVFCTDLHFLALLELRSLCCLWSTGCGEAGFPGSNEAPSVWGKPIAFHRSAYSVIQAPATQPVLLFVESCGSWAAPGWERASGRLRTLHAGLRQVSWTRLLPSHLRGWTLSRAPGLTLNLFLQPRSSQVAGFLPLRGKMPGRGVGLQAEMLGAQQSRSALVLSSPESWQVFLKWTPCLIFNFFYF